MDDDDKAFLAGWESELSDYLRDAESCMEVFDDDGYDDPDERQTSIEGGCESVAAAVAEAFRGDLERYLLLTYASESEEG